MTKMILEDLLNDLPKPSSDLAELTPCKTPSDKARLPEGLRNFLDELDKRNREQERIFYEKTKS